MTKSTATKARDARLEFAINVSAEEEVMAQQAGAAPIPIDRDDLGSRDIRVMFGHSVPLNETATPEREEPQKKGKKRYDPRSIDIRTIFRR